MKIKNITEQDIEDIIRINNVFMKEYMPENIEGDRKTWEENLKNFWPNTNVLQDYVCAENEQGENIGFAGLLKPKTNESWFIGIVVLPEYQTSTANSELLESILEKAKEQNAPEIRLATDPHEVELIKAIKAHNIPLSYKSYMLCLEDIQNISEKPVPQGITVKQTSSIEKEITQLVAVNNAAYKDRPNFIPSTEELMTSAYARWGKTYKYNHHLAYEGDKMVGVCVVSNDPKKEENQLLQVFVHPDYRHKGIGSALITRGINEIKESGRKIVKLGTIDTNSEYLQFPQKFGFKEMKDRTGSFFATTLDKL